MKRLSPISYLSFYSVTGFILSVFFIWVFNEIAESVSHKDIIVEIDQWIIANILGIRHPTLTTLMGLITNLGGIIIIGSGSFILVIYLLFIKNDTKTSTIFLIAVTGGFILNNFLKLFFQRPRPINDSTLIDVSGWSFPSGHSMNSIIFYGMLSYLLMRSEYSWRLRIIIFSAACSLVFIVGVSRIYLQVHYLSDVIAGFSCGLFWLCICITVMELNRKRKKVNGLT